MLAQAKMRRAVLEKYFVIAGLMVISAVTVPKILEHRLDGLESADNGNTEIASYQSGKSAPADKKNKSANPLDGRKTYIKMDSRGHFVVNARMNKFKSEVLVDTGATYVAINESTARKMGIRLRESDFKHPVRTANGITHAAAAMIDEITIGRVSVKNVRASVSRDEALGTTLLGMAFLKKLKKFEISGGTLVLTQ